MSRLSAAKNDTYERSAMALTKPLDQVSVEGMRTVKVLEAKTHLSDLLREVEAGEEVVIARGNVPVARLVAISTEPRELGFVPWSVPDSFFDELTDDELAAWDGSE